MGGVAFGVSGALPDGVSGSFSTQTAISSGSFRMTARTISIAPAGPRVLTVIGGGGGLLRATSVTLNVRK